MQSETLLLKEEILFPCPLISQIQECNNDSRLGIISDLARTPGLYFAHANLHDLNAANDISVMSAELISNDSSLARTRDVFFIDFFRRLIKLYSVA